MADTLTVDLKASLAWLLEESLPLSTVADHSMLEYEQSISDGTGEDEADVLWHDERTVSASAHDDLDLTDLTMTLFGGSVDIEFAKVKAILVVNTSTTTDDVLRVGGAGATAFSAPFANDDDAVVEVGPDSPLLLVNKKDGWEVTPSTAHVLRISNPSANAITYRIAIVGTSA